VSRRRKRFLISDISDCFPSRQVAVDRVGRCPFRRGAPDQRLDFVALGPGRLSPFRNPTISYGRDFSKRSRLFFTALQPNVTKRYSRQHRTAVIRREALVQATCPIEAMNRFGSNPCRCSGLKATPRRRRKGPVSHCGTRLKLVRKLLVSIGSASALRRTARPLHQAGESRDGRSGEADCEARLTCGGWLTQDCHLLRTIQLTSGGYR